jgi:hypothetical protein
MGLFGPLRFFLKFEGLQGKSDIPGGFLEQVSFHFSHVHLAGNGDDQNPVNPASVLQAHGHDLPGAVPLGQGTPGTGRKSILDQDWIALLQDHSDTKGLLALPKPLEQRKEMLAQAGFFGGEQGPAFVP